MYVKYYSYVTLKFEKETKIALTYKCYVSKHNKHETYFRYNQKYYQK